MQDTLLVTYCPEPYIDDVKNAAFSAGAGIIGDYSHCAWQTRGTGQFKANSGSKPFIGTINNEHKEPELKLEILINSKIKAQVIQAIKQSHPYETPVIYTIRIDT